MQGSPLLDVRNVSDANKAETLLHSDCASLVLIYADWCGHCHTYLPQWNAYENLPRRNANILKVHHDMVEHIPTIQHAKIKGYPSVIKVLPNGSIQEYDVDQEKTNALPHMRDKHEMIQEFQNNIANGTVSNILPSALNRMKGSGRRRHRSYKSPKKVSIRGSTRKHKGRKGGKI